MIAARTLAVFALLVAVSDVRPQNPPDAIKNAVRDLGDESFQVRRKAFRYLWEAGDAAEAPLREAAQSRDPEVARLARQLLDRIIWKLPPGTPDEIIRLVERYRNGSVTDQADSIRQLVRVGPPAHAVVMRLLINAETDRRRVILDQFAYDDFRFLATLVADKQTAGAEQILQSAFDSEIENAVPHLFALRLPVKGDPIPELRRRVEKTGTAAVAYLLALHCRATDDRQGFLWAAERSRQTELLREALVINGHWDELLMRHTPPASTGLSEINRLAFQAAYQRLAGRPDAVDKTASQVLGYARGNDQSARPWFAAKALILNERPKAAVEVLNQTNQRWLMADYYAGLGRFADAMLAAEKAAAAERSPQFQIRMNRVALLVRLGLRGSAKARLDELVKEMADVYDPSWIDRRIELEQLLGRSSTAAELLVSRVSQPPQPGTPPHLGKAFAGHFPILGEQAEIAYRLCQKRWPNDSPAESLKRVRRIEDRSLPNAEVAELVTGVVPTTEWLRGNDVAAAYVALAKLTLEFGRPDLAVYCLRADTWKNSPPDAIIVLGDALADSNQWSKAAEAYRRARDLDRTLPLPAFLLGHALIQSGHAAEGTELMESAHRIPMGSESIRYYFTYDLRDRGFAEAAQRELMTRIAIRRTGSWFAGQTLDEAARHFVSRGDYSTAATMTERNLLRLLPFSAGSNMIAAYPRATAIVHIWRARAFLDAGDKPRAFQEMELAKELHPAHLERPIVLVPALESAGERARASALFDETYDALHRGIKEYPESAELRNQMAWLCARCRRRLDEARIHAEAAVRLTPNYASYLDTLAEVQFQQGERDKAIETIKQCLKLPSRNRPNYRAQLQRFERGDLSSEPVPEG
jgi:tetratricopeptide (TPR) repeat protein